MTSLDLRTEQRQTLSPRLQRAVRLLQLSSLDFAAQVAEAAGSNPFLEADEVDGDAPAEAAALPMPTADESVELPVAAESDFAPMDDAGNAPREDDRDLWHGDAMMGNRRSEDGETSAMEMMAVETSLNTHLHGQLNLLPLPPRDLALAKAIVESLDDDGYLRTPLEEILETIREPGDLDPPVTLEELHVALRQVQALEPAGVGARTVAECIELQLPAIDCPLMRKLAHTIVEHHLTALASRDVASLARQLGEPVADVQKVCDRIRRLDPRPGWRYSTAHIAYVVPDVLVKKHRGQWIVQLNPAIVPKVKLNQVYAELFTRHRTPANTEMANHLQEARWTLRNVEQRFSTILSVAEAIVRRQKHFLEFGAMAMKPLGLKEIAEEVGLHESTVSRVTTNKYMSTPAGVFELKYFFSRAMVSANGKACSGTAIRGLIKDMIEGERPDQSLSDAEITRQLAQQGLVVARRTVTKYRQLLRIEPVDRRRRH